MVSYCPVQVITQYCLCYDALTVQAVTELSLHFTEGLFVTNRFTYLHSLLQWTFWHWLLLKGKWTHIQ